MIHVTSFIRSFFVIALSFNTIVMLASERYFDPYSSSSSSTLQSQPIKFPITTHSAINRMKLVNLSPLFALFDQSIIKMHQGYDVTTKLVIENPKQASAVAVTVILLGLMWYKSEAIKVHFNSEKMEKYKTSIVDYRDSAVTELDKHIQKIPYPMYPVVVSVKDLIAFVFKKIIAMDGEYVVGAFLAPVLGYINSLTPFAGLYTPNMGYIVAGGFLVRGWMGIDAAQINRNLKKVEDKVVDVEKKVEKVLEDIKGLNSKIDELPLEVREEIEAATRQLGEKVDSSIIKTEQAHLLLQKTVGGLTGELEKLILDVKKLPSKGDTQKVIDEALAVTVERLQNCIAESVKALDETTEKKLNSIKEELANGFQKVENNQGVLGQKIEDLAKEFTKTIDEREQNIKVLTEIVDATKISNGQLLEKFSFVEKGFVATQEAFKSSNEKYTQLLEEKTKDWSRLEQIISDQILGFESFKEQLSELNKRVTAVDEKTDKQYEQLSDKIGTGLQQQEKSFQLYMDQVQTSINLLTEELRKTKEEAAVRAQEIIEERKQAKEREDALRKELNALTQGQDRLAKDVNKVGKKIDSKLSQILDNTQKSGEYGNSQLTFGDFGNGTRSKKLGSRKSSQSLQQLISGDQTAKIGWSSHNSSNNF